MRYHFTTEIPIVRPSMWNPEELIEGVRKLSADHRMGNILFGAELNSASPRLDPHPQRLADERWLWFMKGIARWNDKTWDFDPGTTAHVYLRRTGGGDAPPYVGKIKYVKGGKVVGFRSVSGGRALLGYYRDMAKLGIYIP